MALFKKRKSTPKKSVISVKSESKPFNNEISPHEIITNTPKNIEVLDMTKGIGIQPPINREMEQKPSGVILPKGVKVSKKIVKNSTIVNPVQAKQEQPKKITVKTKKMAKKKKKGLFKKVGKVAGKVGKVAGKAGKVVGKAGKAVGKAGKFIAETAGETLLLPLRPFKPMIKKGLKSKGVNTSKMSFVNMVNKFYNEFVSKKNKKTSSFDEIPDNFLENHPLFSTPLDGYDFNDSIDPVTITAIVTATVKFFKNIKDSKAKAKATGTKANLSPVESEMADDTEKLETKLIEKAKGEEPVTKTENKSMVKYLIFAGIALVAVIFFMRKK